MSLRATTCGSRAARVPAEQRGDSLGRSKPEEPGAPTCLWAQRATSARWLQPCPVSSLLLAVTHMHGLLCLNL